MSAEIAPALSGTRARVFNDLAVALLRADSARRADLPPGTGREFLPALGLIQSFSARAERSGSLTRLMVLAGLFVDVAVTHDSPTTRAALLALAADVVAWIEAVDEPAEAGA